MMLSLSMSNMITGERLLLATSTLSRCDQVMRASVLSLSNQRCDLLGKGDAFPGFPELAESRARP
jgi:hypothetical protein